MRHKWSGKAISESSGYKGGVGAICTKCGCVKEIIGGRPTYFIRDTLYEFAPKCEGYKTKLSDIVWASVSVSVNHIWLKTQPISDEHHFLLIRVFRDLLKPIFRINKEDEIGFYHDGIFSITIFRNCKHTFWMDTNCPNLQKYADDPFLLFSFNGR